jgi:hypothetical protein
MGVRIGLVGVGSFGTGFVRLFRDHPLVSRLALCDVDGGRLGDAGAPVRYRRNLREPG